MDSFGTSELSRLHRGRSLILAGIAFAAMISVSSGAFAQQANCVTTGNGQANFASLGGVSGSASAAFVGAIGNINTAFISQQGSAFVSAPQDPGPNQPGGGVWVRGVGGEVNTKSTSNSSGVFTAPPVFAASSGASQTNCANSQHTDFGGVQVGQDISRLNIGGWNLHLGTTAGYVSAHTTGDGFSTNFEVPFIGTYLVATYGRFFADVMVREDFYNVSLSNPGLFLPATPIGARGLSVGTSAGYNFALANNWFIEPSAGFIWSSTKVDSFSTASPSVPPGATSTADISSQIGRLSLRVGTTMSSGNITWQPFASASVLHEFAGAAASSYASNSAFLTVTNGSAFPGAGLGALPGSGSLFTQQTSTSRIGTYGQYSLGLAGSINNTGWLGFVRVDYRNGSNLEGWTGNAGVRYQFSPETIAAVLMPTKVPVKARPIVQPVNWTGFYVGGFLGAAYGNSDIRFVGDPANSGNNPRIFGVLGGGQAGYNYQVNSWVFGVEGDIGGTNTHGARTCGQPGSSVGRDPVTFSPTLFSPFALTCGDSMNWLATATARVGWSNDRTLYYVKGGGAWTNETTMIGCVVPAQFNAAGLSNTLCRNPALAITNGFNTSASRAGWTLGFGTEFDLGNRWSAKAEYDYISFGSRTGLATDGTTMLTTATTVSEVKIGVNYRFSGPAAVVAKY
jgi:opacity protein-like surface antigen